MMNELGKRLKNLRKSAGLSQSDFADKLNVHLQTISKWERGISEPDIAQMGDIATILGVSLEKLFGCQEGGDTYDGSFSAENLGQYISALRTQKNENQQQLAEICSTSADAVSRWERGVTCPDTVSMRLLVDHFEIPVSKLYYAVSDEVVSPKIVKGKKNRKTVVVLAGSLVAVTVAAATLLTVFLVKQPTAEEKIPVTVTVDGVAQTLDKNDWFMPQAENRIGYDFVEWQDEEGNAIAIPYQVTKDCVFNSVYSPREYYIDYWLNGGMFATSGVQTVFTVESGAVSLVSPVKTGAVFEGWYLNADYSGDTVTQITCQAESAVLYAKWNDVSYTIHYELNGGILQGSNPTTVSAESEVVLVNPIRKGYLFLGWYDAADDGSRYETVGGQNGKNLTLYAQWQKNDAIYTVRYELNGGTLEMSNPETINLGEVYSLNSPAKAGHEFLGWNDKANGTGKFYTNLYGIQNDLSLYAIYKAKEYLVKYEYEGVYAYGEVNPNKITYGDSVTLYPVHKNGYTFTGWFTSAEGGRKIEVIHESNLLEISTLYARFSPNSYEIKLDADGGTFMTSDGEIQSYTYHVNFDDELILPNCAKGGYVFLGWKNGSGEYVTKINALNIADMTLTAAWRESDKRYTITYELNGGMLETENPKSVLCGQVLPLSEPMQASYIFLGWYDNNKGEGDKYTFTPVDRETDLILYALWQEIKVSGSSKDFAYEKNLTAGNVTITGYNGAYGKNVDLIIPSVIEGLPVVAIERMRYSEKYNVQHLRSLTIPEGMIRLGDNALKGLWISLPFTIPASVEEIGEECFKYCDFSELYFAEGSKLKTIDSSAFESIDADNVLHLPAQLEELGYRSFYMATMAGVVLPDSLKRIYSGALLLNVSSNGLVGDNTELPGGYNFYLPNGIEYVASRSIASCAEGTIYAACSESYAQRFAPQWNYGDDNNVHGSYKVVYGVQPVCVLLHDEDKETELIGNAFELPVSVKDGYTFIGWRTQSGRYANHYLVTEADCELYAVYEPIGAHDGRALNRIAQLKSDVIYEFDIRGGTDFYFKPEDLTVKNVIVNFDYNTNFYMVKNILYYENGELQVLSSGRQITVSPQGYFKINLAFYPIVSHVRVWITVLN